MLLYETCCWENSSFHFKTENMQLAESPSETTNIFLRVSFLRTGTEIWDIYSTKQFSLPGYLYWGRLKAKLSLFLDTTPLFVYKYGARIFVGSVMAWKQINNRITIPDVGQNSFFFFYWAKEGKPGISEVSMTPTPNIEECTFKKDDIFEFLS